MLPAVALPLAPPLTAELVSSGGGCWAAQYDAAGLQRNDGEQLKAKDH